MMTAVADLPRDFAIDDSLARRNAIVLAADKALATLPVSIYVLGMWQGTLPVGALAKRFGRRTAFQIGTVFGILTGIICCLVVLQGSFLLLNIGTFFSGLYAAAHQAYRFAAADTASDAF